uniref:hypothetical protein n=1 Tax=uncultured Microbulbifer sp. TaxID=348147 RepID=UPI0026155E38
EVLSKHSSYGLCLPMATHVKREQPLASQKTQGKAAFFYCDGFLIDFWLNTRPLMLFVVVQT